MHGVNGSARDKAGESDSDSDQASFSSAGTVAAIFHIGGLFLRLWTNSKSLKRYTGDV